MFYDGAVTTYSQNKPLKGYFQGQVSLLYGLEKDISVYVTSISSFYSLSKGEDCSTGKQWLR